MARCSFPYPRTVRTTDGYIGSLVSVDGLGPQYRFPGGVRYADRGELLNSIRLPWEAVYEMDLEDGTHTCYGIDLPYSLGLGYITRIWVTQMADDTWAVEYQTYSDEPGSFHSLDTTYMTDRGAKRAAKEFLREMV